MATGTADAGKAAAPVRRRGRRFQLMLLWFVPILGLLFSFNILREGMDGGGYVLVTADEVPADAQLDNLKVMVETADKHGRY